MFLKIYCFRIAFLGKKYLKERDFFIASFYSCVCVSKQLLQYIFFNLVTFFVIIFCIMFEKPLRGKIIKSVYVCIFGGRWSGKVCVI